MRLKWARASARFFCGRRLAERDAGYSLKGVKSRPRRGKFGISNPCGGSLPRKGKVSGSPGFAKPGADQCLDPPALPTATDAPLAFGMEGDFSLCIAEEIPIPVSFQIVTSSLVFQGGLPPVFRRIFALCPAFQRRVGYLPYPRGKSGTQGRQRLLLFFTVVGGMCFASVFPVTKRDFPSAATTFGFCFQFYSRDRKVICNTCAATTQLLL